MPPPPEEELDEEAPSDQLAPEQPLASSAGLGSDLPEADVLDQWREEDFDDER